MCQANICASNANRLIDNFTELFGNQSISGFAMLAAYDLNADGLMDGIIGSEANDNAPSRAAA